MSGQQGLCITPAVSVFGSARVPADHPYYKLTVDIAEALSNAGFSVISGGGPGLMEAINKGASLGKGSSIGLNINLPHEQKPNDYQDISINKNDINICEVDHFLPHLNKSVHNQFGANINGVWNLVLADKSVNRNKSARIPEKRFLQRLFNRNEFYIESKHPLAETIINQTGKTKQKRIDFLNKQYQLAIDSAIITWKPEIELNGNF